jgi:hypothetical protein
MLSRQYSLLSTCLFGLTLMPLTAADSIHIEAIPRVGPQVLVGTSGFEPGIFAEWHFREASLVARPELFLNEDERAGGGAMIGWEMPCFSLPEQHHIIIGPRVVYHNSDESGIEADLMGIWSMDIHPASHGRHFLEVITAIGAVEKDKDGDDDIELGATVGISYAFQF